MYFVLAFVFGLLSGLLSMYGVSLCFVGKIWALTLLFLGLLIVICLTVSPSPPLRVVRANSDNLGNQAFSYSAWLIVMIIGMALKLNLI